MAGSLYDLVVNVSTSTASLETGLARVGDILNRQTQQWQRAVSGVSTAFAALGVSLSAAAFAGGIKSVIDFADSLNDLSKRTGIAVETLGGLGYAAKQNGVELETVAKGTQKLAQNMADAAAGGKQTEAAFASIGVQVKNLDGTLKPLDATLFSVADKFASYADGPEKAALATELFGKAGAQLIPLLDEGGEKLRALVDEYQRYGGITTETAQRADLFNDTLSKIQLISGSLFREIASALLPTLQKLADLFLDAKTKGEGFSGVAQGIVVVVKGLGIAAIGVVEAFKAVGTSIGAIAAAFGQVISGDFKGALATLKLGFGDVTASVSAAIERAKSVWSAGTADMAATSLSAGSKISAPIVKASKDAADGAKAMAEAIKRLTGPLNDLVVGLQREGVELKAQLSSLQLYGQETRETESATVEFDLTLGKLATTYQTLLAINPALALGFAEVARAQAVQNDATKVAIDVEKEYIETRKRYVESLVQGLDAIDQEIRSERERSSALGKTRAEVIDLAIAQIQANDVTRTVLEVGAEEIRQQDLKIAKLRELRGVVASNDAQEAARRSYQETFDYIDNLGREAFAALTGSGENAAKRIAEVLKTQILGALYKIAIQPFVVQIAASISGQAAPGSGIASGIPGLGGGGGLGGLGNIAGSLAPSLFGAGSAGAAALGAGFTAGIETLSIAASAGTAAIGGMGAALGAFAAVAGPVAVAIGAAYLIADSLGAFERGGLKGGGSASAGDVSLGRFFTPEDADETVQKVVDTISATYTSVAQSLGASLTATFGLGFDTDPKGTADNRISSATLVGGNVVRSVSDLGVGRDDAELTAALATEAQRSLLAALQASNFPTYLANIFDSVDAATATTEQINGIIATAQAMKLAVDTVAGLGGALSELQPEQIQGLVEAFGGLDRLTQGFAFLTENFTTQADKIASATDKLNAGFAALGQAVPASHADFLALVDSLVAAGDAAGAASLVALAPLFIQVAGTADQAAAALASAAKATTEFTDAAAELVPALTGHTPRDFIDEQKQIWADRLDSLQTLASQGVTFADQLGLAVTLTGSQIDTIQSKIDAVNAKEIAGTVTALDRSNLQYIFLPAIKQAQAANAIAVKELARFTVLTAQFDAARAEQLLGLEQWYAEQQSIFAGNADALAAAQSIFDTKWKAVVDGVTTGVDGTIDQLGRLKQSIADYLKGLVVSDIAPFSAKQKLAQARAALDAEITLAATGDTKALGDVTQFMDTFLKLDREFNKSNDVFAADFNYYTQKLADIAGVQTTGEPLNAIAAALPSGSKLASGDDIKSLEDTVKELIAALANSNTADAKMLADAALKAAQQTAADTTASAAK